jgi:hypothetical protein
MSCSEAGHDSAVIRGRGDTSAVRPLRALPYRLGADGKPSAPQEDRAKLAELLTVAKLGAVDSPVYQLRRGFSGYSTH